MKDQDTKRFENLSYEDFRKMAKDTSLSAIEKIGFPNSYREGKEKNIFNDIVSKLTILSDENRIVLDIGPGCSELAQLIVDHSTAHKHELLLVDSAEMLSQIQDGNGIKKYPAYYPECPDLFREYTNKVDVIIVYSVFHYIFIEQNYMRFLDKTLELLAPGGQLLLGDIPNQSKRRRFFCSENGVRFHQKYMNTQDRPLIEHMTIEHEKIDDSIVFSIVQRARLAGFDAYIVPQAENLPMANRREDILIVRP